MSKVCDVCGKRKASGNNVTFSHRGIKRTWTPNLRKVRVYDEKGTPKRLNVCTRCLRNGAVNRVKPATGDSEMGLLFTEEAENVQDVTVDEESEVNSENPVDEQETEETKEA